MSMELIDSFNRRLDYLRISVTDRCNLRCIYCMPEKGIKLLKREQLLTYEEILRAVKLFSRIGIRKVRLTGGEPLLRENILTLIKNINMVKGIEDISLTTNGLFLNESLSEIHRNGIERLNISCDSLDPEKYKIITRGGSIDRVITAINSAIQMGFKSVKINVVLTNLLDENDIIDFVKFSIEKDLSVRFIEMMPVTGLDVVECNRTAISNLNSRLKFNDILSIMNMFGIYEKVKISHGFGPAVYYRFIGGRGSIGFISNHDSFCLSCNRIRLTPYGGLKLCLFSPQELNMKDSFRRGLPDEKIMEEILDFIKIKPLDRNNSFTDYNKGLSVPCYMNKIGG